MKDSCFLRQSAFFPSSWRDRKIFIIFTFLSIHFFNSCSYHCLCTWNNNTLSRLLLLLQDMLTNADWLLVVRVALLVIATSWCQDKALGLSAFHSHFGDVKNFALLGLGFGANTFMFLYSIWSEIAAAQRTRYQAVFTTGWRPCRKNRFARHSSSTLGWCWRFQVDWFRC